MDRKQLKRERVVSSVGLFFVSIAFVATFFYAPNEKFIFHSICPSNVVARIVHAISVIGAILAVIKPSYTKIYSVLFFESFFDIITNNGYLGIFFFYDAIILYAIRKMPARINPAKFYLLFAAHLLSIGLSYTYGIPTMVIMFGSTIFFFTFFIWIYIELKAKLSCLIPTEVRENQLLGKIKPGSEVHLSDYGLTERQRTFILEYLNNDLSYKDLSEKFYVSISTVKREFSDIFQIFGVKNIENLHILLLQYQIKE